MISVRLEPELEQQLTCLSKELKISKSQIIKDSLCMYFDAIDAKQHTKTAFKLDADLFGRHASGDSEHSAHYKQSIKDKIHAKNAH